LRFITEDCHQTVTICKLRTKQITSFGMCNALIKLYFIILFILSVQTPKISDELKKKISESYSIFRSRVIEDLRPRDSEWSEIQQSCV